MDSEDRAHHLACAGKFLRSVAPTIGGAAARGRGPVGDQPSLSCDREPTALPAGDRPRRLPGRRVQPEQVAPPGQPDDPRGLHHPWRETGCCHRRGCEVIMNAHPPKGVGFVVQDSSPVPSKARPKVSHPRWAEAPSSQRDRVSTSLHLTSSQADHMTKVPGSIRQPGLAARGVTVGNRLRGRTAELTRFRPGE